jgi:hypothetical protein
LKPKNVFDRGKDNSATAGEYKGLRMLDGVVELRSIDVLGLSGAKGSTCRGMIIGTCFEQGLNKDVKFWK